jgi:hypothetical protein
MAFVTTGLPNGGVTAHYKIEYDDSLSQADGRDRAAALMAVCEADFTLMTNWFGGIALPYAIPYEVQITPGPGASASWGSGPPITLIPGNGSPLDIVRYLLVAEVTEMFMLQQGLGWSPYSSSEGTAGEGLSHFLATQLLISIGSALRPSAIGSIWLNSPRADFVNHVDWNDHSNDPKSSCAVLFLWYLFTQLGFSVNAIVGGGANELSGVYRNLTGDTNDPFPYFKQLLDAAFPSTTTSSIPGPNRDNPYPVGALSFWVDKNTFGKDEVTDVLASPANGLFSNSFWLVLEGFNRQVLGTTVPGPFTGAAAGFAGLAIPADASGAQYELGTNQFVPQRIRFPFDVQFSVGSLGAFPASGSAPLEGALNASMTILGRQFSAATILEFVPGADPYFTNIDPSADNVFWLSQDLRVFTATPSLNNVPVPGGPVFGSDDVAGAYGYIQALMRYLNATYGDPTGNDPFNAAAGVLPAQAAAYDGDSSVTPQTVVGGTGHANYNFGVARVRLRGTAGPAGEAQNVRVFFRLWSTQSADTDYQPGSTYPSHLDAGGLPDWPQPASDGHTIPFFATSNSPNLADPNNLEYGSAGVNNLTVMITSGDSRWAYFGCFLNVYDAGNLVNGVTVQSLLTGTHHCIVAQIAYDGAPIVNAGGVTERPENSDKLAQRNLQITHSSNPGQAATHRIPQTFDLRPSPAPAASPAELAGYPDELMIDWGATPAGSLASIYWPQVSASDVLRLAAQLYGTHQLSAGDPQTIRCAVTRGVTYVPIPADLPQNLAGLLTVDLPPTVVKGQEFNGIVRRVSTRRFKEPPVIALALGEAGPRPTPSSASSASTPSSRSTTAPHVIEVTPPPIGPPTPPKTASDTWRYVVGTFQVRIPVSTEDAILPAEEDTLAIFKWRLQAMAPSNRWHPVLRRYVGYLSARVDGLGGDAGSVRPSLSGSGITRRPRHLEEIEFIGKVVGLRYDRFGDCRGFLLRLENGRERSFKSDEDQVEDLVRVAWLERYEISVFVHRHAPDWPVTVILRRAPRRHSR